MRQRILLSVLAFCAAFYLAGATRASEGAAPAADWSLNATIIEACSCPMFCQCYFNPAPAGHHMEGGTSHFCKFNNVFKVNKGSYGSVKLDGAKFWVLGDLGGDFSKNQMDWARLYFDKSMTKEQRDAVAAIMGSVYPVKWNSFTTAEGTIDTWTYTKDAAHAALDGGKTAEVKLKRFPGNTSDPVVIKNLKYWGVPRNEGFVLMPNEVEAYRGADKPYEYKGTNGFMITIDMNSKDLAPKNVSSSY
jgi:hypothetical protein